MSLFESHKTLPPLPERSRPVTLEEYVGQTHIIGKGRIIATMLEKGVPFSMILWGPPGCGKTTLARIIADALNMETAYMSAVSASVGDVRKVIEKGKQNRTYGVGTLLFLDEIHRFNKAQQDSVLHAVESGDITLIGATTENPSFSVISPLLSRTRVLKLEGLRESELEQVLDRALAKNRELASKEMSAEVRSAFVSAATGDARRLLNIYETAFSLSENGAITITDVEEAVKTSVSNYDKKGERHYDTISAFIKSMRGSDPDGAVYYLARMLEGGEDPLFIARRMVIFASEDVGNASPTALNLAVSAMTAVQNIGMPEARITLAQCALFLAASPKSNASYNAINQALELVGHDSAEVPMHIRNAPTKLMESFGYKKGYKYPHDYPGSFVDEVYLPKEHTGTVFYKPTNNGTEEAIARRLEKIWPGRYDK